MKSKIQYAKNAIGETILNHVKSSIKRTIEATGCSFVIGHFPYWEENCEFIGNINPIISIVHATSYDNGHVMAAVEFDYEFQKQVFEKYNFILNSILHITFDRALDHFPISCDEDLDKLENIELPYLFINTDEDVARAEQFIIEFQQLLFLHALS